MVNLRLTTVVVLCVLILSGGCRKKAPQIAPAPPPAVVDTTPASPPAAPPPDSAPTPPAVATEEEIFAGKTLEELNAERPLGDALFDVDQASIRADARAVLQKNSVWLQRWLSTRITIEGHCDSRGTSEYNLALGERRASAVKQYLVSLGVSPDRIAAVSKGKEAPVCTDEHETCWQQNRRGASIITGK